jgi:hypothetical protein
LKFDFDDAQEGFLVARLKQFIDWNFYQKNAEVYQDYSQSLTIISYSYKPRSLCCLYYHSFQRQY